MQRRYLECARQIRLFQHDTNDYEIGIGAGNSSQKTRKLVNYKHHFACAKLWTESSSYTKTVGLERGAVDRRSLRVQYLNGALRLRKDADATEIV